MDKFVSLHICHITSRTSLKIVLVLPDFSGCIGIKFGLLWERFIILRNICNKGKVKTLLLIS